VKAFYGTAWRPDRATIVVVGDVTKAELERGRWVVAIPRHVHARLEAAGAVPLPRR